MSLIADALKAAQQERERQEAEREAARRVLNPPAAPREGAAGAFRRLLPFASGIPRGARLAGGGAAALALGTAAVVFALSPRAQPPRAAETPSPAAQVPAEPVEPFPDDGDTAPVEVLAADASADAGAGRAEPDGTARGPAEARRQPEARPMAAAGPRPAMEPGPLAVARAASVERTVPPEAGGPGRFRLSVDEPLSAGAGAFQQGLAAQRRRDFATAVELYRLALQHDPSHAEVHNNLGTALQALGELPAARDAFREAVRLQPGFAAAWSNLGVALDALGEQEGARQALAQAVRLDPANPAGRINLALHYEKMGAWADAVRLLREVVGTDPGLAEAHYALARLMEQQGDAGAAVRHYRLFLGGANGRFPQLEGPVRQRLRQLEGGV